MEWIDRIPFKRAAFVLFALIVFGNTLMEILSEFAAGEPLLNMSDDLAMFGISGLIVAFFGYEYVMQQRALSQLQDQLDNARGQLMHVDANSQKLANQYREIMQQQFDAWALTSSEQDVVLSLLKGLSFREVAELRETREKTVRQQAASVYKKAGVSGRHELAAWFFEDMLDPPTLSLEEMNPPSAKS